MPKAQIPKAAVRSARATEEHATGRREIENAVEPGRDPIAAGEHGLGDLRLNRIHVVHKRWRRDDATEIDGADDDRHGDVDEPGVV